MPRWASLEERVFAKLMVDPSGCLLWQGVLSKDGYGRVMLRGRRLYVHRVMFEIFTGPIPDGLEPDHLCRVRRCASVAHLELVTHRENMLRGLGVGSANSAKTECDHGHEFTQANTYIMPGGGRDCRACIRDRAARYKARRKVS